MKLSIVIPTYNRAYLLPRAIESVLAQSYEDWELIVVDDGSTDDTEQVMQRMISPKIMYVKFDANQGVSAARNRGASVAHGTWVSFLDSDDAFIPGALMVISEEIEKTPPDIGMLFFQTEYYVTEGEYIGPGGYITKDAWTYYRPSLEDVLTKKNIVNDMHRCYRTEVIRRFPYDELIKDQDTLLFASILKGGIQCLYVHRPAVNYYVGGADRISVSKREPTSGYRICSIYFRDYLPILKRHPELYVSLCMNMAICCMKLRKPSALFWISRGFMRSPRHFFSYVWKHVFKVKA